MELAFFVKNPRRFEELFAPHLIEQETIFKIVRTVSLRADDYENFITDMLVSREFLEDAAGLGAGDVMRCVFVRRFGKRDGVLVVPQSGGYVEYAAYISHR